MKIRKFWPQLGLALCAWLSVLTGVAADLPKVDTPRQAVTTTYHGTTVSEDYQWLENAAAPAVKDWTRAQNERTAAYFMRLPFREEIARQLAQLRGQESARFFGLQERKGRVFAMRFKPPAQQPMIVLLENIQSVESARTVFDPNAYNAKGTTSIDWFLPSLDGRLVAVCLSENGSEDGTLHFFEVDTGKELADRIPRVQYPTGGGSVAWTADSSAVLYTRYPHSGERPEEDVNFFQQVWFHKLGTAASEDRYEIGKDFPRIAEIELESSEDGRHFVATVANGDGGDFAHYLRDTQGRWKQLTRFEDQVKVARFGRDSSLYLITRKDAPRGRIMRLSPQASDWREATDLVPQQKGVVLEIAPADNGIYVSYLVGGPSELRFFPKGKQKGREIPVMPVSTVAGLQCWHGDEVLFGNVSYVQPFAYYTWTPKADRPSRTGLFMTSPADFSDLEVTREFARSRDGTKVPLNILRKKGTRLNGNNPTLLYGYGGYGISMTPAFDSTDRIWFDAGGIYVVANLRGGGEYGEEWHKQGNLTRKQNVFDDFIAAAEYLVRKGYTSKERLAVEGGSNGGLLMGAFLTQRPDLARAVVSHVGIYDMLRVELDPNGQFNVTEFGTVKDPNQFKALYAYSPLHRVRDGVAYPAVLLPTGENDGRVNPMQSRKMAARLQAATSSGNPILFRSTASAGHGIGTALSERIALQADVYAFLFKELGVNMERWMKE